MGCISSNTGTNEKDPATQPSSTSIKSRTSSHRPGDIRKRQFSMQRQRRLSAARPGTLSLKGGDAPPPSAEEEADLASPAYLEKQISQMHLDYLLHKTSCAEFAEADLTSSFRNTDALVARTISDVSSRYELRDDSFTMNQSASFLIDTPMKQPSMKTNRTVTRSLREPRNSVLSLNPRTRSNRTAASKAAVASEASAESSAGSDRSTAFDNLQVFCSARTQDSHESGSPLGGLQDLSSNFGESYELVDFDYELPPIHYEALEKLQNMPEPAKDDDARSRSSSSAGSIASTCYSRGDFFDAIDDGASCSSLRNKPSRWTHMILHYWLLGTVPEMPHCTIVQTQLSICPDNLALSLELIVRDDVNRERKHQRRDRRQVSERRYAGKRKPPSARGKDLQE
ncbi:hypothetical protein DIPPA_11021 [Diplonema papillatum]|nr:hypothetical protein DIPPA_11021 [Diplonema papillatum]